MDRRVDMIAGPPPMRGIAPPDARLQLLEELIVADEVESCAEDCVEWLAEHTGAERVLCAVLIPPSAKITGLAAHGIDPLLVADFSVDAEDPAHPFVAVMQDGEAFSVVPKREAARVPQMGNRSFAVVPFGATSGEPDKPTGLLLIAPADPAAIPDAVWLARILSEKIVRLRMLGNATDADKQLHRERGILYSIINAVPDPILLTDAEGRMIVANSRAETYLVAGEGESEGRHRAVALNNMLFSAALSRTAIEGEEGERRELLLVHPSDGSDRLFELISSTGNHPTEPTGIVSVLRNVTDLRTATEQLEDNYRKLREAEVAARAERDRLDLIIDSVVDPIVVTDPSGAIVHMNAPAERLFTASSEEHGEDAVRVVRANDALFSSFLARLLISEPHQKLRGELLLTDPITGYPMPVEAISGIVKTEQGELTALVTILHDQREALEKAELYEQLKRASEQLEQKVRDATAELVRQNELLQRQHIELEQASNLKSQFLANMSHEFRTPLNAILGYTSMLLRSVYGEVPPAQGKGISRIEANARHLLTIINDILDIAKIEAGKMPVNVERFAIDEVVREVMAQVEPLKRDGLQIEARVSAKLPKISTDKQKLKQIVLNLLTNAIKFTPEGKITVLVKHDTRSGSTTVAVKDTGIGIAPADQDKIFEDFRQVDSSLSREYGGTGLGLSICRRLATMIGADIRLESTVGAGSTFTLVLPKRPPRRR
jgi:PAS domain S-box-containing protein